MELFESVLVGPGEILFPSLNITLEFYLKTEFFNEPDAGVESVYISNRSGRRNKPDGVSLYKALRQERSGRCFTCFFHRGDAVLQG